MDTTTPTEGSSNNKSGQCCPICENRFPGPRFRLIKHMKTAHQIADPVALLEPPPPPPQPPQEGFDLAAENEYVQQQGTTEPSAGQLQEADGGERGGRVAAVEEGRSLNFDFLMEQIGRVDEASPGLKPSGSSKFGDHQMPGGRYQIVEGLKREGEEADGEADGEVYDGEETGQMSGGGETGQMSSGISFEIGRDGLMMQRQHHTTTDRGEASSSTSSNNLAASRTIGGLQHQFYSPPPGPPPSHPQQQQYNAVVVNSFLTEDFKTNPATGESAKVFSCKFCLKFFTRKEYAQRHVRHNHGAAIEQCIAGSSELQAALISKSTRQSNLGLDRYVIVLDTPVVEPSPHYTLGSKQMIQKPYKCALCDIPFTRKAHVRRHLHKVHKDKFPEAAGSKEGNSESTSSSSSNQVDNQQKPALIEGSSAAEASFASTPKQDIDQTKTHGGQPGGGEFSLESLIASARQVEEVSVQPAPQQHQHHLIMNNSTKNPQTSTHQHGEIINNFFETTPPGEHHQKFFEDEAEFTDERPSFDCLLCFQNFSSYQVALVHAGQVHNGNQDIIRDTKHQQQQQPYLSVETATPPSASASMSNKRPTLSMLSGLQVGGSSPCLNNVSQHSFSSASLSSLAAGGPSSTSNSQHYRPDRKEDIYALSDAFIARNYYDNSTTTPTNNSTPGGTEKPTEGTENLTNDDSSTSASSAATAAAAAAALGPPPSFDCGICEKKFSDKAHARRHVANLHIEDVRDAAISRWNIATKQNESSQDETLFIELENGGYRCSVCATEFSMIQRGLEHASVMHPDLIRKAFSNIRDSSEARKPYKCAFCTVRFTRRDHGMRHLKKLHPEVGEDRSAIIKTHHQTPNQRLANKAARAASAALSSVVTQTPGLTHGIPPSSLTQMSDLRGGIPDPDSDPYSSFAPSMIGLNEEEEEEMMMVDGGTHFNNAMTGPSSTSANIPPQSSAFANSTNSEAEPLGSLLTQISEMTKPDVPFPHYYVDRTKSPHNSTNAKPSVIRNNIKRFECDQCQKLFTTRAHGLTHMRFIHSEVPESEAEQHLMPITNGGVGGIGGGGSAGMDGKPYSAAKGQTYECNVCDAVFDRSTAYRVHHRRKHGGGMQAAAIYPCEFCGEKFPALIALIRHKKIRHFRVMMESLYKEKMGADAVPPQSSSTSRKSSLVSRRQIRACHKCGKTFDQRATFQTHLCRDAFAEQFQCVLCSKTFTTGISYEVHIRRCMRAKSLLRFICTFCFAHFTDPIKCVHHELDHLDDILLGRNQNEQTKTAAEDTADVDHHNPTDNIPGSSSTTESSATDLGMLDWSDWKFERLECRYCPMEFSKNTSDPLLSPSVNDRRKRRRLEAHQNIHLDLYSQYKPHRSSAAAAAALHGNNSQRPNTVSQLMDQLTGNSHDQPRQEEGSLASMLQFEVTSSGGTPLNQNNNKQIRHLRDPPTKCRYCGIEFKYRNSLAKHEQAHEEQNNPEGFQGNISAFGSANNLYANRARAEERIRNPYSRNYVTTAGHRRPAPGDRPDSADGRSLGGRLAEGASCSYCGIRFKYMTSLRKHQMEHQRSGHQFQL